MGVRTSSMAFDRVYTPSAVKLADSRRSTWMVAASYVEFEAGTKTRATPEAPEYWGNGSSDCCREIVELVSEPVVIMPKKGFGAWSFKRFPSARYWSGSWLMFQVLSSRVPLLPQ